MNQRQERGDWQELDKSRPGFFKQFKPKTKLEKIREYNAGIRRLQEKIRRKNEHEQV